MQLTKNTLHAITLNAIICHKRERAITREFGELKEKFCEEYGLSQDISVLDYIYAVKKVYEDRCEQGEFNRIVKNMNAADIEPFNYSPMRERKPSENKVFTAESVYSYQVAKRGKINIVGILNPEQWNYTLKDGVYYPFEKL